MSKEAITNLSAFGTLLNKISKLVRVIDSALICGQRGKVRDQILRKAKGWGVSSKNLTKLKLTEKKNCVLSAGRTEYQVQNPIK